MIKSNLHTHSTFSDGKNTPEEIINTAIEKGFETIGISDHSYTFFDVRYCMTIEKYPLYKKTVSSLKEKFRDKIEVLCGTELDFCSTPELKEGFDYYITGVHYVNIGGVYYPVDSRPENVVQAINEGCGGDENRYIRLYFENVANCAELKPLYMAHFDLLTKFGKIDETSDFYKKTALEAADALIERDIPIEVNTGAMAKGVKNVPYPAKFILEHIAERKGSVILGSDCHDMTKLTYAFESSLELIKSAGVKDILEYRGGKLTQIEE